MEGRGAPAVRYPRGRDDAQTAPGPARHHGVAGGRGALPRNRPRGRLGDRRPARVDHRPRPARPPRRRPPGRAGLGYQREDHDDPADRRGHRRTRPGRDQLLRCQHADRPHVGARQGRGDALCRPGGRRALPAPGARRHRPEGDRAAEPLARPARPGQGGGDDGPAVARRAAQPAGTPRGQRRRPDGRLGRLGRYRRHLGGRRAALARRLVGVPGVRRRHRARR